VLDSLTQTDDEEKVNAELTDQQETETIAAPD
jgi:hypothetical protein